ncbi:NUMOD4 domain-containing protein [Clostridium beijerinckii]|uniref:NUMOD4 domain-containing protein n=1 Tax=Clostridium beijerinckii TaxID=1520 RepID=UPI0015708527|nr:NUMOD4 domain-containing protein [Clostridium beijerinckii]NRU52446.1 DNA-directed RNA polymerase subunit RPC12/RpoP [Clostridium beijerinckii]NYC69109.1 DNA-directed RNA polymerase subunit RPC12/RpoP [Clostridium beijerinckii]NYC91930.1 DNA-directed RNA polymerase subunit RPC12/RpoP [Clostridium beijerinckii]
MEEIWRDVVGFEKYYQVSNLGRIKSLSRTIIRPDAIYTTKERILKKARYVTLSKDGIINQYYVRGLVVEAFKDNIDLISEDLVKKENVIRESVVKEKQQKVKKIEVYKKMRETYKVRCITTGKEFDSINQANIYYGIQAGSIARCCKGIRKSAGRLEDGTKLIWEYINDDCSKSKQESECIKFHCPYCGSNIFMNIKTKDNKEIYKKEYNCSCGCKFKVEYDKVLAELNINIGTYLLKK